nr:hypothetical protein Iba_chr06bCG17340 [Ipomoea batatas]GMD08279.1 hypothetical protein Iba_chr06cCG15140 [Ipomoea batatas]
MSITGTWVEEHGGLDSGGDRRSWRRYRFGTATGFCLANSWTLGTGRVAPNWVWGSDSMAAQFPCLFLCFTDSDTKRRGIPKRRRHLSS